MDSWIFLRLSKQSLTLVGPMVLDQAKHDIASKKLSVDDLVYLPDVGWKRIFSVERFSSLLMPLPNVNELDQFERKAKAALPSNDEATVIQSVIQSGGEPSQSRPVDKVSTDLKATSNKASVKTVSSSSIKIDPNDRSTWFLQFEGSEFGPFTVPELGKILDSGKLKGKLYAWKKRT